MQNNPQKSKRIGGSRCTGTLWPLTPATRSHRFGAIPPRTGSSATSTGPCRPSLTPPELAERVAGVPRLLAELAA